MVRGLNDNTGFQAADANPFELLPVISCGFEH